MQNNNLWKRILTVLFLVIITLPFSATAERIVNVPSPTIDNPKVSGSMQTAILAGGCFWGIQGVYQHLRGVTKVLAGYSGGEKATAKYELIGRTVTGHAEVVEITFDPQEVSYGEILKIYFSVAHDPTQLDQQGPDMGPQYRSNIFYIDDSQKRIAEAYITQLKKAKVFNKPIVTRVDPLKAFYPAEEHHQDFIVKNPQHYYVVSNDIPKILNFKKVFPAQYRGQPVTVSTN